jgi:hypothetical protein
MRSTGPVAWMRFPERLQLFAQPQLDATQLRLDHTTEGLQLRIDQHLHDLPADCFANNRR